jgi:hypothetical protein
VVLCIASVIELDKLTHGDALGQMDLMSRAGGVDEPASANRQLTGTLDRHCSGKIAGFSRSQRGAEE